MRYFYKNKNNDFYSSKAYEAPSFWLLMSLVVMIVSIILKFKNFPYDLMKITIVALASFIGLSAWYVWLFKRYLGSIKHVLSYWGNYGLIWQLQTSLLNAKTTGSVMSKSYRILPRIWVYRDNGKIYYRIQKVPGSFERDLDDLGEIIGSTLGDKYEVTSKQLDDSGAWYLYIVSPVNQHLRWVPKILAEIPQKPYDIKLQNGVTIDESRLPSVAIFGVSGSLKTTTIYAIVSEKISNSILFFLDGKQELSALKVFYPSERFAVNPDEVTKVLDRLIKILHKREKLVADEVRKQGLLGLTAKDLDLVPIYLIIDEYASIRSQFKKPKELDDKLLELLMKGRSAGVITIYSSQSASVTQVLPSQQKDQISTIIMLATATQESYRSAFGTVPTTGTVPIGYGYYMIKSAESPTPQRFEVPDFRKNGFNNLQTLKTLYKIGHHGKDSRQKRDFNMEFDAFKKKPKELEEAFRRVKHASLEEARNIIEGEEKNVTAFFIARNIISEISVTGTVYFYKNDKPYRIAVARFDIPVLDPSVREYFWNFEGQVIKLGRQLALPQLGSAVPEIQADRAGIVYTVDDIYTKSTWKNHPRLLSLKQHNLRPFEDVDY